MATLTQKAFDRKSMPEYPFDIGTRWVKDGSVDVQIPLTEDDFLHPEEDRSISHREAARFMSFPDRFEFVGAAISRQIGNSVPPLLARAIGEHLMKILRGDLNERCHYQAA